MNLTDLFGRIVLIIAFIAILLAAAHAAFADAVAVTPREAIERAVARRLGGDVSVTVTSLDTTVAAEQTLEAVPEPGSRAGKPMRFVLTAGRVRRGIALATVRVEGSYVRASQAIARDDAIVAGDVEHVQGELPPVALKRLPSGDEVIGLTARRDIAAGETLTQAVLQVPALVRAGELVAVTATVGVVQVSGVGTAGGSGHTGDIIRVSPRPSGRPMKARITGRGTVEVVQ